MPDAPVSAVDTPPPTPARPKPLPRGTLAAALVAGLLAAVAVPLDRPGVGWAVMGLAAAVTVAVAVRRARIAGRVRWPWALATLALLAVGAFRDSRWLFALCVVTACLTASLAMAGGKTVRGLAFGATAIPTAAVRDLPRVRRTVQLHARRRGGTAQLAAAPRSSTAARSSSRRWCSRRSSACKSLSLSARHAEDQHP